MKKYIVPSIIFIVSACIVILLPALLYKSLVQPPKKPNKVIDDIKPFNNLVYFINEHNDPSKCSIYKYSTFINNDTISSNDTILLQRCYSNTLNLSDTINYEKEFEKYLNNGRGFTGEATLFLQSQIDSFIKNGQIYYDVDESNEYYPTLDFSVLVAPFFWYFTKSHIGIPIIIGGFLALVLIIYLLRWFAETWIPQRFKVPLYILISFYAFYLLRHFTYDDAATFIFDMVRVIVIFLACFYAYKNIKIKNIFLKELVALACFILIVIVVEYFYGIFYRLLINPETTFEGVYFKYINVFLAIASANIIHEIVSRNRALKELKIKSQQNELDRLELASLQSKLNPHFLYNVLNSLVSLVDSDKTKAKEMIHLLSHFYKNTLANKHGNIWTVREELDAIKNYLQIEKMRFGDTLSYDINIDDTILEDKLPTLLLQPLMENAIKYGYNEQQNKTYLRLEIKKEGRLMKIKIYDIGKDFPTNIEAGYGTESVQRKLTLIYGSNYELSFENGENKHILIEIKDIPI